MSLRGQFQNRAVWYCIQTEVKFDTIIRLEHGDFFSYENNMKIYIRNKIFSSEECVFFFHTVDTVVIQSCSGFSQNGLHFKPQTSLRCAPFG